MFRGSLREYPGMASPSPSLDGYALRRESDDARVICNPLHSPPKHRRLNGVLALRACYRQPGSHTPGHRASLGKRAVSCPLTESRHHDAPHFVDASTVFQAWLRHTPRRSGGFRHGSAKPCIGWLPVAMASGVSWYDAPTVIGSTLPVTARTPLAPDAFVKVL